MVGFLLLVGAVLLKAEVVNSLRIQRKILMNVGGFNGIVAIGWGVAYPIWIPYKLVDGVHSVGTQEP
jgi:hypothetical protein